MTLVSRYIASLYLRFVFAAGTAVLVIFLIVDFADRVNVFAQGRAIDILELYWNKALIALLQLGPAAVLLAAGACVSTLRQRGELTALRSLSFGTRAVYLPIALCALLLSGALVAFDEWLVTGAGQRVDQLHTQRFNAWGDWRFFYTPKRWFRSGERIFFLRRGDVRAGFGDVTLLSFDSQFHVRARLDAEGMSHAGETRWELSGAVERTFAADGSTTVRDLGRVVLDLGVTASRFRIQTGRPEQMRVPELREQIALRDQVGLPTQRFRLALHQRFAYPLTALPAALLAVGLALRPGRRGHLTMALLEALCVAVLFWGLMVVGKALALGGRMPPQVAAWGPLALLVVASGVLWLRREGRLGRGGS